MPVIHQILQYFLFTVTHRLFTTYSTAARRREEPKLYFKRRNAADTMIVGGSAPSNRFSGEMPSGKNLERMDWPAGLGAFAITVKPPPATAPATTAYLRGSVKLGTCAARYVMAALSF